MRSIFILIFLILFSGCGKKADQEVDQAIDVALSYLSKDKCDEAIDVLEDVGRDTSNPVYLQVLASAYACRADFSEVDFLKTELSKIKTTLPLFMKSLTQLKWSVQHKADSTDYVDMRTALDVLLDISSAQPSQAKREATFGPRKAGDIGMQILLMNIAQLGKFLHFYGNVSAAGVKGAGAINVDEQTSPASNCFLEYNYTPATTFLAGAAGTCNSMASDDGHPNLTFAAASLTKTQRRMCEGLMLVTNMIDIFANITLPDNVEEKIGPVKTVVAGLKTSVTSADSDLATLIGTTSQEECERLIQTPAEFDNLQYIYALVFETGLP